MKELIFRQVCADHRVALKELERRLIPVPVSGQGDDVRVIILIFSIYFPFKILFWNYAF